MPDTFENAVESAIEDMPESSELKPFLQTNKEKVVDILFTEFAIERDLDRAREEGREEGKFRMFVGLVKDKLITLEQAAEHVGMTIPEFEARAIGLDF